MEAQVRVVESREASSPRRPVRIVSDRASSRTCPVVETSAPIRRVGSRVRGRLRPIEGLVIKSGSSDVAVAAQFLNASSLQTWSAWLTPGSLIGTRQKGDAADRFAVLKLVGNGASRFEINGEALFLGSPRITQRGGEVEFAVVGGSDPLVGLRIAVIERVLKVAEAPSKRESRVRVFR